MAIMRSKITKGEGPSWLGIKKASLKSVKDESSKYDWADVYLILEFDVEESKYTRPCKIVGSFEKNPDGTIMDCSLLKRITYASDAFGFQGGVNQNGKCVDENEEPIDDIATFLESNFAHEEPNFEYLVYVFKELAKNGKTYTRIHSRFMRKGNGAEEELDSYIKFLLKKGYLKEAADDDAVTPDNDLKLDGLEIASL